MNKVLLALLALVVIALVVLLFGDYDDSTSATAPNGEPIGAQHPQGGKP
jgi:hypothetical protein